MERNDRMHQIAIVTGASSGIGREMVKIIDREYPMIDEIWVVARREERLNQLADETFTKLKRMVLDLSQPKSVEQLEKALAATNAQVKLLINAAGYGKFGKVGEIPRDQELGMIKLNCEAMTAITGMVLPYIQSGGQIIQIASSAAFSPMPSMAVYAATKAYVLSYSRALNEELKPRNISVTAVCPGPVKTEFFDVAESHADFPLISLLPQTSAKREARHALNDSRKGKAVSTYGPLAKGFRVASKVVPAGLVLWAMGSYLKNKS